MLFWIPAPESLLCVRFYSRLRIPHFRIPFHWSTADGFIQITFHAIWVHKNGINLNVIWKFLAWRFRTSHSLSLCAVCLPVWISFGRIMWINSSAEIDSTQYALGYYMNNGSSTNENTKIKLLKSKSHLKNEMVIIIIRNRLQ